MIQSLKENNYWLDVWIKFKSGDQDSFKELYTQHIDSLFAYGSKFTNDKELIKDCLHDLFINLFQYNISLSNPESLKYYLFRSFKNLLLEKLKRKHFYKNDMDFENYTFHLKFNLEEDLLTEETKTQNIKELQTALKSLDSKKRELLFLKFQSGLTYKEIGQILNIKPDTVKKQVYKILSLLRLKLDKKLVELFLMCYKT